MDCQSHALVVVFGPDYCPYLVSKENRLKFTSTEDKLRIAKNRLIYFDRAILDPTEDAGSRVMFDVLNFLINYYYVRLKN